MKILFLPLSFPGPFRYTATHLAADKNNKVIFVTDRSRRDVRIPGVKRILISIPQIAYVADRGEMDAIKSVRRATQIANALVHLKNSGFTPDLIISSAGYGCSLYVKDVFPNVFLATYADGYHTSGSTLTTLRSGANFPTMNFSPDRVRNLFQWSSLHYSQMNFTSTSWQKSLYPDSIASKIKVLHEGVDASFFSPLKNQKFVIDDFDLSHVDELVTFSGRSVDTKRNFPQFLNSIPQILEERPNCHVIVMAGSHEMGTHKDTWIKLLNEKFAIDQRRVHIMGFRPYKEYRLMLQASNAHVFLTAPQSLSTGIFEAMSCGCLVLAGDTEPVREVIRHGENGFLYDLNNADNLAKSIIGLLESGSQMQSIRDNARQTILNKYDSKTQTVKNIKAIFKAYENYQKSMHAENI